MNSRLQKKSAKAKTKLTQKSVEDKLSLCKSQYKAKDSSLGNVGPQGSLQSNSPHSPAYSSDSVFSHSPIRKESGNDRRHKREQTKSANRDSTAGLLMSTLLFDTVYDLDESDPQEKKFRIRSSKQPEETQKAVVNPFAGHDSGISQRSKSAESIDPPLPSPMASPISSDTEQSPPNKNKLPSSDKECSNSTKWSPDVSSDSNSTLNSKTQSEDLKGEENLLQEDPEANQTFRPLAPVIIALQKGEGESSKGGKKESLNESKDGMGSHKNGVETPSTPDHQDRPTDLRPAMSRVQEMIHRLNQKEAKSPSPSPTTKSPLDTPRKKSFSPKPVSPSPEPKLPSTVDEESVGSKSYFTDLEKGGFLGKLASSPVGMRAENNLESDNMFVQQKEMELEQKVMKPQEDRKTTINLTLNTVEDTSFAEKENDVLRTQLALVKVKYSALFQSFTLHDFMAQLMEFSCFDFPSLHNTFPGGYFASVK